MRNASSGLIAFLLSRQPYYTADLFDFILENGTTNYWTSYNKDIVANGHTYQAVGPVIQRTRWNVRNTMEVPTMDINLLSTGTDYGSTNIKLQLHNGLLDGAKIILYQSFMPVSQDVSLGAPLIFGGQTSNVSIDALGAKITVKGLGVLLQQYMPKNTFQLSCIHTLYDAGCGLNPASSTASGVVGAVSDFRLVSWATPRPGDGFRFGLGTITITSGAASGQKRTIMQADDNNMRTYYPFYEVPQPGDTFTATYGCDRSYASNIGCAAFANQSKFRGFQFIPPAETAY